MPGSYYLITRADLSTHFDVLQKHLQTAIYLTDLITLYSDTLIDPSDPERLSLGSWPLEAERESAYAWKGPPRHTPRVRSHDSGTWDPASLQ